MRIIECNLEVFVIHRDETHARVASRRLSSRSKSANFAFTSRPFSRCVSSHSFQSWISRCLRTLVRVNSQANELSTFYTHVTAKRAARCPRGRKFAIWSRRAICCYVHRKSNTRETVLAQRSPLTKSIQRIVFKLIRRFIPASEKRISVKNVFFTLSWKFNFSHLTLFYICFSILCKIELFWREWISV